MDTPTVAQVSVRQGTANDLDAVRKLVMELAVVSEAGDQVTVDDAEYARDFAAGNFRFLVATDPDNDDDVVGLMLYYPAYSTWKGRMLYLEDFIVAERARRRGVGQVLWAALVAEAKLRNCSLIKWQVLDWNEPARAFYKKAGAELEAGWENCKLYLK